MNTDSERSERSGAFRPEPPEFDTLDLVRYWRAIARNRWRILGLVLAVGVLAMLIAYSLAPVYRGTATLLLETGRPKVVSIEEVYSPAGAAQREHYQTQVEIIHSRELAEKLVRRLKLTRHPAFDPRQRPRPFYADWLPEGLLRAEATGDAGEVALEQAVAGALRAALTVRVVRNSQLVTIGFESSDPGLAAQVPNALAELYIQSDLEARMQVTRRAMVYLTEQSEDLRKKLLSSEKALQDYREREQLIDAKGVSLAGASRELEQFVTSLVDARKRRAELETALNQTSAAQKSGAIDAIAALPTMQRHPLVMKSKEAEAEAERKLNEASKRYGSEHPRMIAAQGELKAARENVRRQIGAAAQSLRKEFEVARSNEAAIARALDLAKADIQSLNRKEFQLTALERDVASNRQLYEMFTQRSKEANVAGDMQTAIARVVDAAVVPRTPSGPNKQRIVLLSMLGALMVAAGLALLIDRLDNTVKTSYDLEAKLEVPTLGVVQLMKVGPEKKIERLFLDEGKSVFAEAIRTIRSGVLLSALDSPHKTVLVTSSVPEEGKTTVTLNLAHALAQLRKTLLIDADMRRPRIAALVGAGKDRPGLSDLVAGQAAAEQCIHRPADSDLHVLAAGRVPPNPLDMLASRRFKELLEQLRGQFEVIILDSPPVQMVSDALVLSQLATEVLYVVRADHTPYPVARQALKRLRRVQAPILGAVLNQLDIAKADKYYGEYSGYGSGKYDYYGK